MGALLTKILCARHGSPVFAGRLRASEVGDAGVGVFWLLFQVCGLIGPCMSETSVIEGPF